jgi:hypothetical protein
LLRPFSEGDNKGALWRVHIAPFWTILPQSLNCYYWFIVLSLSNRRSQQQAFKNWISAEFQKTVENSAMTAEMREMFPTIRQRWISAGVLEPAVVQGPNGKNVPCYHVHPVFTLLSRSYWGETFWKHFKFAYVRQILLWNIPDAGKEVFTSEFQTVKWGGREQHEDYVHNLRVVAMAWSLEDGDWEEEVARMGISLFECVYTMSIHSLHVNRRQPQLFIPHIRKQLLHLNALVSRRPAGVPTSAQLDGILSYSLGLQRLGIEDGRESSVVAKGLEAAERRRAACGAAGLSLRPDQELSWFQLRHAEATMAMQKCDFHSAKLLFARNLADDPTFGSDHPLYCILRRCHLNNLNDWAGCVQALAFMEGTIDKELISANLRQIHDEFKPGRLNHFLPKILKQHEKDIASMTVRDQSLWAIEREPDTVLKFGTLANKILASTWLEVCADLGHTEAPCCHP